MIRSSAFIFLLLITISSYFNLMGLTISIPFVAAVFFKFNGIVSNNAIKTFKYFLIPIFIGLICGIQNDIYLLGKDVFYFLIPFVFACFGMVLARYIKPLFFLKTIVVLGVFVSLISLYRAIAAIGLVALIDPYSARLATDLYGNPSAILAFSILMLTRYFKMRLFSKYLTFSYILLCLMGTYITASRTYYILVLCFMVFLIVDIVKKNKGFLIPSILVGSLCLYIVVFGGFFDGATNNNAGLEHKLLRSFDEINIKRYNTEQEINDNYRGYESFQAFNQYSQGSILNLLLGKGLGKTVDLNIYIKLGDTPLRYIPILHNGYLYVLFKTGILGVLFYLLLFGKFLKCGWRNFFEQNNDPLKRIIAGLLFGSVLGIICTNYVVSTLFNPSMCIIIVLLGYTFAYFINSNPADELYS